MGQQPNIDDLFRGRLYDAEATPPPFVWSNVEAALRKRRRRWFLFSLLALGFAGAGFWYVHTLSAGTPMSAETGIVELRASNPAHSGAPENALSKAQAATVPEPASKILTAPQASAVAKMLKAKSPGQRAGIPQKHLLGKPVKADFFENTAQNESTPDKLSRIDGIVPDAAPAGTQQPANNPETAQKAIALSRAAYHPNRADADAEVAPEVPLFLVRDFDRLPLETTPIGFTMKHQLERVAPALKKGKEPRRCYSFAKDTRALLLDVYGGPSLARKELTVANAENNNYLQQRLRTEKQDWAFNAGVRATYVFQRNLLFRGGLHYDQNVEIFEHFDPNSVKVVVEYRTRMIGNQKITETDTISIDYGEEYIKSYNRFGMLELPLMLGMELRAGNTGLSLNGGASVNLLFWKRGAMLGPDGKPAWFSKDRQEIDVFRSNTGLSLVGSVQWFWHLRPRLRVFAEPYARHILKPISIPGYPVQQRGGFWGLKVGFTKIVD
jgi:hypothetical protein